MIDLKLLRQRPEIFTAALKARGVAVEVDAILELDERNRALINSINQLRTDRRAKSKRRPSRAEIAALQQLGDRIQREESTQQETQAQLDALLAKIPNLPAADVPVGSDERSNRVLRTVGAPPGFDFPPRPHWELGAALEVLDTERAAMVSGARFVYLKGRLALLQFALIQFALTVLTDAERLHSIISSAQLDVPAAPFTPVIPPVFIRPAVMQQMARLEPKEERYYIASDDQYLIGSAEHTLGPLHLGETLPADRLPLRYVGYSTSFRREAGSYGKDTKGMIRVHQFDKLEMESFTAPEHSLAEQEFFVALQEHLMQQLGLPYRVVLLCTGDMGAPDSRQVDLETWMPGLSHYKETHSADLVTDYQARRLNTRLRRPNGRTEFAHMNDATVFAMGRTLAAIMENYQQADGDVVIPEALRPFVPGTPATIKRG